MARVTCASLLFAFLAGCSSANEGQVDQLPVQDAATAQDAAAADSTPVEEAAVAEDAAVQQDAEGDAPQEAAAAPDAAADSAIPGADCDSTIERRFACCTFVEINKFRVANGVEPLAWDQKVAEVAEWYSEFMADKGVLAHGLDGRKVGSRLSAFGIDWSAAGENIARNTTDAWQESCVQVFDQWDGSPAHHELMQSDNYTFGGVGVAKGGDWWYATLNVIAP